MQARQLSAQRVVELVAQKFSAVQDRRVERTKRHPLLNILVLSLCGAVCGADGWDELEEFARSKRGLFDKVLPMPHGTPSADTFRRVLSSLHPVHFEACMRGWVAALAEELAGQVVALDGKSVRGALSRAASGALRPLHLLHAWAAEQQLLLGQVAVDGAPGEVAGLPHLIGMLDVEGAVLTADANGCTGEVAEACVDAGGDYVLCLKGNRGPAHTEVREALCVQRHVLDEAKAHALCASHTQGEEEQRHGRLERRRAWAFDVAHFPRVHGYLPHAASVLVLQRQRTQLASGETSLEVHFYVSTRPPTEAGPMAGWVRAHWEVENGLHRELDCVLHEDAARAGNGPGAQNLAVVRRVALAALKADTSFKASMPRRVRQAAHDDAYRTHLVTLVIS
jgi:predicted transposase YbfD/YdcC